MPERGVKEQSEQFPNRNKPPVVEHVRTHNNDDSVTLDLLVHWDISEVTRETEQESTQMWQYEEEKLYGVKYEGLQSEIEDWLTKNESYLVLLAKQKADDLTKSEKEQLIDYETGQAIDSQVHPASGVDEQIGILRYALTELYNRLGESVPVELDELNEIANAEIQNGQDKKSDL